MRRLAIFLTVAVALTAVGYSQAPGRINTATPSPPQVLGIDHALQVTATAEQRVVFNVKTLKYHCPTCSAAKRCTKSCINTTLADALQRGGVACKLCGGACRNP